MKFPSITILFGKDVWILPGIWGPTGPNQSKVFKILKQREIEKDDIRLAIAVGSHAEDSDW